MDPQFERLHREALEAPFVGWDFSYLEERTTAADPPWEYRKLALPCLEGADAALDMGTGGGEWLADLSHQVPHMWATEGYAPNVPLARQRLSGLGICLTTADDERHLPLPDEGFDVVLNRHESYNTQEVWRILRPHGVLVTQQVGSLDAADLNRFFGDPSRDEAAWHVRSAVAEFEAAGFKVVWSAESFLPFCFHDISAVIYYLKAIPWQIPGLSLVDPVVVARLEDLYREVIANGQFLTYQHRFAVIAKKTSASACGGVCR